MGTPEHPNILGYHSDPKRWFKDGNIVHLLPCISARM